MRCSHSYMLNKRVKGRDNLCGPPSFGRADKYPPSNNIISIIYFAQTYIVYKYANERSLQ